MTITSPLTGIINYPDSYSGKAFNLRPGQLVWTFNQPVNTGTGAIDQATYPDSGPCDVNYSRQLWVCHKVYIGRVQDTGTYRVCVAILNTTQAFEVVTLLKDTKAPRKLGLKFSFLSPPPYIHDHTPACMSARRVN